MLSLNLLLYIKVTIAAGVGQQGNWDNQSDISVRLGSPPAVGDTLTMLKFHRTNFAGGFSLCDLIGSGENQGHTLSQVVGENTDGRRQDP